ncbi:alpha/beta hydrolase [Liquorilactobacillus oeni]|uniref:Cell surface hydrolase n=1 Tax=Liquorilactobacillus oeni DSM 19972 TaxID=1423777 RepID=A0A0R1MDR1_9LACO|nr:alpha/beta hydrolase [Liquorilactobacillus oeni]KRL06224.1 cell surface hydrolase [Liquorilactobacillus oeni DSM 19972]
MCLVCILALLSTSENTHEEKIHFTEIVPTIYLHGYDGSAASTNKLISAAQKSGRARKTLTVQVAPNGHLQLKGKWSWSEKNPLIQVIFTDNTAEIPTEAVWLKNVVSYLQQEYSMQKFNVVSHSMSGPVTYYWAVHLRKKDSPILSKFVPIAGPFNRVIYIDDTPNQNSLDSSGKPVLQNAAYRDYLKYRNNFPKQTHVLNIFGNLEDGSNSDGLVTNTSARSLAYLLRNHVASYQELMVKGPNAQHTLLHSNNATVDQAINNFLWKK